MTEPDVVAVEARVRRRWVDTLRRAIGTTITGAVGAAGLLGLHAYLLGQGIVGSGSLASLALVLPGALGIAAAAIGPFVALGASNGVDLGTKKVRVDAAGLTVEGLVPIAPSELAEGEIIGGAARLRTKDGRELVIDADDARTAALVLDRLGLGAAMRRVSFAWRSWRRGFAGGLASYLAAGMVLGVAMPAEPVQSLICVVITALWSMALGGAVLAARREVTVGRDGLRVAGAFGSETTLFADVTEIVRTDSGLELVKKDGTRKKIRLDVRGPVAEAIARRVRDAFGSGAIDGASAAALLGRAGRAIGEWREALRTAVAGTGFRDEPIADEKLVSVLEDPTAAPDARVGAALALSERSSPELARKIRVAAEACAAPRMRVALSSLADGAPDEDAIDEVSKTAPAVSRAE